MEKSEIRNQKIKAIAFHPLFRLVMLSMIVVLLLISCEDQVVSNVDNTTVPEHTTIPDNRVTNDGPNESPAVFSEEDLRYRGAKIALTYHARCRMDCREIDAYEIQEVIDQGHINARKSKDAPPGKGKCPTTAYEGTTRDNQFVRVILGTCKIPKIITVIDLKNDYQCTCK
jgi:hypothetical protein